MADAHKNFATSQVATAPSPATSGTSLVVTAGQGSLFPTPPFNATIWPSGAQPLTANAEIVRVTAISTDTFTITRTQEATSARTVVVGDQIAATITAKTLTDAESASAMIKLFDSTLAAANATIDTGAGSIPGTYAGLEIWFYARSDEIVTGTEVYLQFNADSTTGHYDWQRHVASGTADTISASTSDAGIDFYIAGGALTASYFSGTRIWVPNYAGTTGFKPVEVFTGYTDPAASDRLDHRVGTWHSTAAITRLAVTIAFAAGKQFQIGSRLVVFGVG